MARLTKTKVEKLPIKPTEYFVWDDEVTGFGVRVMPSGVRTYQIQYRKGGRTRRSSIGRHGVVTVDQARLRARELLGLVATGRNPVEELASERRQPTVAMLCDRFLEEPVSLRLKPSTRHGYRQMIRDYIKPALGSFKVKDIERKDIADLHHKRRLYPYQANRMLALLSKMFNLAEMWGLRPDGSNPCRHVPKFKERTRERFLTKPELQRLGEALAQCETEGSETPHVVAAFRLLILTGCRLGEIQTLRWDYITPFGIELPDSKTGARRIPLPQRARGVLAALPRSVGNPFVIEGKLPGSHITDLQHPWRRIRERAGLDGVRIHDLRHTYASHAVCSGMPIQMVGRLLGHTQLQTTLRYAHLADEPVRQAAEENAGLLGAALGLGQTERKVARLRLVE
jgi:integrase